MLDASAREDPRIRVAHRATNGGIVAASNDALSMACGEFVALLDHDDRLVPTALEQMAATIDSAAEVDYVYSDEAHVLADGRESAHFLKPDWSPERFQVVDVHLPSVGLAARRSQSRSAVSHRLRRVARS